MAGRIPNAGGFDPAEKVNSNTLKRHPKMDLSRNDLLQLLSYLEGELQARDVVIATLKAEKAKQLLYQAKYGRFGLGDPFSAMQRDSDNMADNTFDESAIKSMYDNQLAQLENLIATQRKAQMKMREQMLSAEKKYHKVSAELEDERRKHAQDTAQGDDVTYMLEKERERLNKEVDFEKGNTKKMEKDLKKTLASLEEERASSGKHKQVALMLIKERRKLVERYVAEKERADEAYRVLAEERSKSMNMAEGLVQESKKSLKMEATMERQASEFDVEREQWRNRLQREENRNKDLLGQVEQLSWQLENEHKTKPAGSKDAVHTVEIKQNVSTPQTRLSSERTTGSWSPNTQANVLSKPGGNIVEREAGLSPRSGGEFSVRKRDNMRYASPQTVSIDRGHAQFSDSEGRVGPVGAVSDNKLVMDAQSGHKLSVSVSGPTVVSSGGRILVHTSSPGMSSGPVSPRRMVNVSRGTPPPIPPNKPSFPVTTASVSKPIPSTQKQSNISTTLNKDGRMVGSNVHIPISVVHTSSVSTSSKARAPSHEGSPASLRKPAQFGGDPPSPTPNSDLLNPPTSASFDFLGQEMADLQQLLVSMVTVSTYSSGVESASEVDSVCSSSKSTFSSSSLPDSMTSSNSATSPPVENMTPSTLVTSHPVENMTSSKYMTSLSEGMPSTSDSTTSVNDSIKSHLDESMKSKNKGSAGTTSLLSADSTLFSESHLNSLVSSPYVLSKHFQTSDSEQKAKALSDSLDKDPKPKTTFSTVISVVSTSSSSLSFNSPQTVKQPTASSVSKLSPTDSNQSSVINQSSSSTESVHSAGMAANTPRVSTSSVSLSTPLSPVWSQNEQLKGRKTGDKAPISTVVRVTRMDQQNQDIPASPIHRYASLGVVDALRKLIVDLEADVNLPMKDGTTPAHCAAKNGQEECLQLLLERGCHVNSLRDDQQTPVHCAASNGHIGCLKMLLAWEGNPCQYDGAGWSPLHWAAYKGHTKACRTLLEYGAQRRTYTNNNWTPLHLAVQGEWPECLDLLLTWETDQPTDQSELASHVQQMASQVVDRDGQTIAHMAAAKQSQKVLSVLLSHCGTDLVVRDRWGRTVADVASPACHQLLQYYESGVVSITVELQCSGPLYSQQGSYLIGQIKVHPSVHWSQLDRTASRCLQEYLDQLDRGLRTKKTVRLDPDSPGENESHFTLGLNTDSIHGYMIGSVFWRPADAWPSVRLQDVLCNQQKATLTIILKGSTIDLDSLSFDLLLPKPLIESYIRLLEQYRSVVFYGPDGCRKKQLVKRLSRHLTEYERERHGESRLSQVYLHRDYSHRDFVHLLKTEGCMLPVGEETGRCCVLVLFHLEKVHLAAVLASLAEYIDMRGNQHAFTLPGADGVQELYYFPENFYLIATMDKPRSTGLDLGLQQRFRWVHFRVRAEPLRNMLARHLLRRLLHTYGGEVPGTEDEVFKVLEWLLCVWQRLNYGVGKLGLQDLTFGPDLFLPCPLETGDSKKILSWLKTVWNEVIAPGVREAISQGSGRESHGEGQQKVANTALYVLMQRAVVPGCPLDGPEKNSYLSQLSGSNELEVQLRGDKPAHTVTSLGNRHPLNNGSHSNTENSKVPTQNRHSIGSYTSLTHPNNYSSTGNTGSSFKRRSHSDQEVYHIGETEIPIIHEGRGHSLGDIQAKVPKLEIRSPVLGLPVSMPSSQSSQDSPRDWQGPNRQMASSYSGVPGHPGSSGHISTARRSTFSTHTRIPQPSGSRRAQSSENLNIPLQQPTAHPVSTPPSTGPNPGQSPPSSPFSFSLTTPNSSLFSFKMFDKGNERKQAKSRSLSSSPTSLLYPSGFSRR
ncbi:cortactin-binding protein 2-like isoform X2 [Mya arenaria]|uniref:cortactin-binding protein 2-like isoform X2 n=1 Tax=Mya arenaria TaxID=6604 RepID=UPI0022E1BA83|nr:cortactin-binding protein 2-like isoform X2 [Mya arenaria]